MNTLGFERLSVRNPLKGISKLSPYLVTFFFEIYTVSRNHSLRNPAKLNVCYAELIRFERLPPF